MRTRNPRDSSVMWEVRLDRRLAAMSSSFSIAPCEPVKSTRRPARRPACTLVRSYVRPVGVPTTGMTRILLPSRHETYGIPALHAPDPRAKAIAHFGGVRRPCRCILPPTLGKRFRAPFVREMTKSRAEHTTWTNWRWYRRHRWRSTWSAACKKPSGQLQISSRPWTRALWRTPRHLRNSSADDHLSVFHFELVTTSTLIRARSQLHLSRKMVRQLRRSCRLGR